MIPKRGIEKQSKNCALSGSFVKSYFSGVGSHRILGSQLGNICYNEFISIFVAYINKYCAKICE